MIIAPKRPRCIPAALAIVLLFAGPRYASAETPGQTETHTTTTAGNPASAETSSKQTSSSSGAPQTQTTGKETGTGDAGTPPGRQSDMLLTPPVHVTGPEPAKTPATPAAPGKPKAVQATQPGPPAGSEKEVGPQVDPCLTVRVSGDTWLDQVHGFVQDSTCEPAVWFDNFFVKDHVLLDLRPGTFIKIRNSAWWTEAHTVTNISDYHIEWELPQWKKVLRKLKLYVESRSEADKYTAQPGQPPQPGVNRATGARQSVVGVRADLPTWLRSLVSIESGVKIGIHPDAFTRMRYQHLKSFSEVYQIRFSEIAMWQAVEHFSNTLQLDLERRIDTFTLVRWANNLTHIEDTPGVSWNSGISLIKQLTPKSAISYDASMWGVNHPDWVLQNYRLGLLYRRNFYRPWLFFELSPEITLPKDAMGQRNSVYAFMATLEVQFGK